MNKIIYIGIIIVLLFFTVLMILITVPYLSLKTDIAFLQVKQWIFQQYQGTVSTIWIYAFYIHVFTSIFVLFAGFTQFNKKLLTTKIHRIVGASYIFIILVLTGPSGFIMALLANGGIFSIIVFTTLAILWWYTTFKAFKALKTRNYPQHARFMYRSYALTLSAITLRLWKIIIANYIYEMPPMDLYHLVAVLGWVPNILIAEILIYKGKHLNLLKK